MLFTKSLTKDVKPDVSVIITLTELREIYFYIWLFIPHRVTREILTMLLDVCIVTPPVSGKGINVLLSSVHVS